MPTGSPTGPLGLTIVHPVPHMPPASKAPSSEIEAEIGVRIALGYLLWWASIRSSQYVGNPMWESTKM